MKHSRLQSWAAKAESCVACSFTGRKRRTLGKVAWALIYRPSVAIERVTPGSEELNIRVGGRICISTGRGVEESSKVGGSDIGRKSREDDSLAGVLAVCRDIRGLFRVHRVELRALAGIHEAIHWLRAGEGRLLEARAKEHIE